MPSTSIRNEHLRLYHTGSTNNWLVTLSIGNRYLERFEKYALPFCLRYSKRYGLNLAVVYQDITGLIGVSENSAGKKKTWQKMLIPHFMSQVDSCIDQLCYFDSDILFNPYGANIFAASDKEKFNVVSERHDLPYDDLYCRKVISFYRNKFSNGRYPLDSSIFMKTEDIYRYHGFKAYNDYCCAGLYVCSPRLYSGGLLDIFNKYRDDHVSVTEGGDEPAFNFEIRERFVLNYLPYQYQAIWNMEMAYRYRSLFAEQAPSTLTRSSIKDCLLSLTCLHFAGSWPESSLYLDPNLFDHVIGGDSEEFFEYMHVKPSGRPVGRIMPAG